jgi:altronate dehydratase
MAHAPAVLRVGESDNVVVAARDLAEGEAVADGEASVTLLADVPFGHKVAVRAIAEGGDVVKYDEVIGRATAAIEPGAHVHVHNVDSARLPG